jgi:hypothetical protein
METWLSPNKDIRICFLDMNYSWNKNAFWEVNNKRRRKWCKFVSRSYLITLVAYLCSQMTPNVQIKYFIFVWWIYTLFLLNTGWKLDSIQMMIFVNICSTWSIVELKTRFETWLTRNDVNGVRLFHLSYLTTLMAYLCPQRTPNVQNMYFMFDCSIYRLFVLNTGWKRDSLQIIIFVNVCSTWSIAELKRVFETWLTTNNVNGVSYFTFLL